MGRGARLLFGTHKISCDGHLISERKDIIILLQKYLQNTFMI